MVTISMISSLILVPLLSAYLQARVVVLTECTAIRQGLSCLMWSPTRSRTGPLRPGTFSSSWGRSASSSQWLYCLCKLYSVIICCTKAAHHSVMLKIKLYNDNSWKVNEKTPVIIILKFIAIDNYRLSRYYVASSKRKIYKLLSCILYRSKMHIFLSVVMSFQSVDVLLLVTWTGLQEDGGTATRPT